MYFDLANVVIIRDVCRGKNVCLEISSPIASKNGSCKVEMNSVQIKLKVTDVL